MSNQSPETLQRQANVPAELAGERVDKVAAQLFSEFSRAELTRWMTEGMLTLDGAAVKSCSVLAVQADDCEVLTIEGLGSIDNLHPMQEAFRDCHALQCGFCTPGMIMQAVDLAQQSSDLDADTIRQGIEGNLCRCTGYQNIVEAVAKGAGMMAGTNTLAHEA